jgi:hypothetical protein
LFLAAGSGGVPRSLQANNLVSERSPWFHENNWFCPARQNRNRLGWVRNGRASASSRWLVALVVVVARRRRRRRRPPPPPAHTAQPTPPRHRRSTDAAGRLARKLRPRRGCHGSCSRRGCRWRRRGWGGVSLLGARTLNRKYGRLHLMKTRPEDQTRRSGPSPGGMGRRGCHPARLCTELGRRYGPREFR